MEAEKKKHTGNLSTTRLAQAAGAIPSGQGGQALRSERDHHSGDRRISEKAQALKINSPVLGGNQGRGRNQHAGLAAMPIIQIHYRLALRERQVR